MELAGSVRIKHEDLFFRSCFPVANTDILALHELYIKCIFKIIKYQITLLSVCSVLVFFTFPTVKKYPTDRKNWRTDKKRAENKNNLWVHSMDRGVC